MKYVGKDVLHEGNGLALDPEAVRAAIPYSAWKNVRKAERAGVTVERRAGRPDEMAALRALWYYPEDPNFPGELGPRDVCYMAFLDGQLVGGMVMVPVGTHLFLNNLLANDEGKRVQLQGYLLWHAVRDLADSEWAYIDVGASYRPNLQRFFRKWSTFRYPILFHPPAIRPRVDFCPFERLDDDPEGPTDDGAVDAFFGGEPRTLLPSLAVAEEVLRERDLAPRHVSRPGPGAGVRVLDLTRLLPLQHGAALLGLEIPPQELWDRHGCFDFVKTEHLRARLAAADLDAVERGRRRAWELYRASFEREDVEIIPAGESVDSFALRFPDAPALAERWGRFGVQTEPRAGALHLPCHQNVTAADVRYVYAVYRGHLNLCSEWVPTHVRGTLKAGSA